MLNETMPAEKDKCCMPSLLCVISGQRGIKIVELLGKRKEVKEMGGNRGINDQSMVYA